MAHIYINGEAANSQKLIKAKKKKNGKQAQHRNCSKKPVQDAGL
ncbi:hypothetical protein [Moorena producens]|nr:hypothetical protein [Moorena producens]